jgi:Domain of unknown function (DUF4185)
MNETIRALAMASMWVSISTGGTRVLAQDVGFFPDSTYKIVQLTGETRRIPTLSRMQSNYCVSGTDLGSTFEHNRQLFFLFGDTPWGGNADFLATATATRPEDAVLSAYKDGSCFHPIAIPDVSLRDFEVPSYGISVGGRIYLVATTDHTSSTTMGRSVMAVSSDDGRTFQKLYDLSTLSSNGHFINVSMVEVDGSQFPTLPAERCVLIWGSGNYRASNVCLAYVPSARIAERTAI